MFYHIHVFCKHFFIKSFLLSITSPVILMQITPDISTGSEYTCYLKNKSFMIYQFLAIMYVRFTHCQYQD